MEVPIPHSTEETGEEIVDVPVPPVDAIGSSVAGLCNVQRESGEVLRHVLRQGRVFELSMFQEDWRIAGSEVEDPGVGDGVAETGGFDPCLLFEPPDWCSVGGEEKKGCAAAFERPQIKQISPPPKSLLLPTASWSLILLI